MAKQNNEIGASDDFLCIQPMFRKANDLLEGEALGLRTPLDRWGCKDDVTHLC